MNNCAAQSGPHKKVYDDRIFTSYPPQKRWICSQCGAKGYDVMPLPRENESYDSVEHRFMGEELKRDQERKRRRK